VAALPANAVAARLGQEGVRWQRLARGEDPRPLLPAVPEERFEQAIDLEWPIEGLDPLSFVLGRLMDPLSAHLDRRGRGAAVLHVRLHLVTRAVHERSLQLPAPIRDARTLRTLALLDLESHPPAAAIDRVVVAVDPTPARVLQFSLLARPLPSPEQISTLMARLTALMGEGRCGAPAVVDTWQPGAFAMTPFAPRDSSVIHPHGLRLHDLRVSVSPWPVEVNEAANTPSVALRRFRFPVPARVRADQGKPSRVAADRRGVSGGRVEMCAGPWRTSGGWWTDLRVSVSPWPVAVKAWDRDEWDVTLSDGATYRVFRDRSTDAWFIEGIVD
jgi:protein ImuB